ncbi:ribonuclease Z [Candidatus Bathyarchaeota archaeon]|nr:ribonuclease Z [Candidatus Bathyarchaeota archaeon]
MTDLEVIFLGTSGSIPTPKRGLSAVAIKRNKELFLFDCGEGTQRQMIQTGVGFHRKAKIFITHMHGDHVLGLPGLIQTMSLLGRTNELEIYGPKGISNFVAAINQTIRFNLTFSIKIREIEKGLICEEKEYEVFAAKANHIEPSLAYSFTEKLRSGIFQKEIAIKLKVPEGPLWSKLQSGESVILSEDKIIEPDMVLGSPRLGRKIVYSGDTGPSEAIVNLAKNADLLIHEATFKDEMKERAIKDGHSTPIIAAEAAKAAGVKRLILTHISARYKDVNLLLKQAKKIFSNTEIAEDLQKIKLSFSND